MNYKGRPEKHSEDEINEIAMFNDVYNISDIKKKYIKATGKDISIRTIKRKLNKKARKKLRSCRKPFDELSRRQKYRKGLVRKDDKKIYSSKIKLYNAIDVIEYPPTGDKLELPLYISEEENMVIEIGGSPQREAKFSINFYDNYSGLVGYVQLSEYDMRNLMKIYFEEKLICKEDIKDFVDINRLNIIIPRFKDIILRIF